MSRLQRFWLHCSAAITALTGIVFAWMKYFMTTGDEFAVVNHPAQPWMLATHVVVAPLLLFILGWTFSNHMLPKSRFGDETNRRSGTSAMWLIIPMTASGYFLQVATNEALRQAMEWAHWVTSGLFVVVYVVHLVIGVRQARPI